jgi:tryptophanyl-tRNA synthetase
MKILIGIQPTGKLTLGNYMGCLAKGLRYQAEGHDVTFLIANYHSLTTDSYSDVTEKELIRLGCKNIKHQTSDYTELFFKLLCKINIGTLLKMPQYKDKKDSVEYDMGLLSYPVLMAADIIINDPDIVVIGKDQVAHMELTNDIAKRVGASGKFAYEFGDAEKIMSLVDPTIKMSKSAGESHVLYLFDEDYSKKLKKANTNEEGLKNLQQIGDFFGVERNEMNGLYKEAIAKKLSEVFTSI